MIEIVIGDIVEQKTDAIVNSANTTLLAGSGISGAIHRAAGPDLEQTCVDTWWCSTCGYSFYRKGTRRDYSR
jgi:O-acetyl-ADP-ribose deacetylase (regulator of RNase III)